MKTELIAVRITSEEKAAFHRMAESEGIEASVLLRLILNRIAKRYKETGDLIETLRFKASDLDDLKASKDRVHPTSSALADVPVASNGARKCRRNDANHCDEKRKAS
jgi:antitoxin component of RelBE/YafQ-DinJ toxin-antitoxin module